VKPQTLSRSSDFRRAYGEGERSRRNGVAVAAVDRGDSGPPRVGYAVRRSSGNAVVRNRIRRRLRAATRAVDLRPGFDIVISGDRAVALLRFQLLVDKLHSALAATGAAR